MSKLKSAMGLLVGAFGSTLGVIGINTGEVSSILRNDEWRLLIVLVCLLSAVVLAFLSAVASRSVGWSKRGLFGGLLIIGFGFAAISVLIPVDRSNGWGPSRITATSLAIALFLAATWFGSRSYRDWRTFQRESVGHIENAAEMRREAAVERRSADSESIAASGAAAAMEKAQELRDFAEAGNQLAEQGRRQSAQEEHLIRASKLDADGGIEEERGRKFGIELQPWLVAFSGLLLGLAVFGAIRLETRNQQFNATQLTASVAAPSNGIAMLTVSISAPRLTDRELINVEVRGVTRGAGSSSQRLELGSVLPDATGLARQTFTVPISVRSYKEVTGIAVVTTVVGSTKQTKAAEANGQRSSVSRVWVLLPPPDPASSTTTTTTQQYWQPHHMDN